MAIVLDVSGSMRDSGNRAFVRQQVEQYLFSRYNQRNHIKVELWAFATEAWRLTPVNQPMDVGEASDRAALLTMIETLHFQTHWPNYYTNWEAALSADFGPSVEHIYMITDGNPTMSQEPACLDDPPCDNEALNTQRAAAVAARLIREGGRHVIPIGVGDLVSDKRLAAIAGPCTWSRCLRNWDYYHIKGPNDLKDAMVHAYEARTPLAEARVKFDHYERYQSPRVVVNADGRVVAMTSNAPSWLKRPQLVVGSTLGEAVFNLDEEGITWVRTAITANEDGGGALVGYEVMPRYHQQEGRMVAACVDDLFGAPAGCSGNDVGVISAIVETPTMINCTEGDIIDVMACYNITLTVDVTANVRYDIGLTVARDGGNAHSGVCNTYGLLPATNNVSALDLLGGFGPYRDEDGDACGDMRKTDPPIVYVVQNISLACVDSDMDGFVDFAACTMWKNMANNDCASEADLAPGTSSKCNCDRLAFDDVRFIPPPTTTMAGTTTTTDAPTTTMVGTTTTTAGGITTTTGAPTTTTDGGITTTVVGTTTTTTSSGTPMTTTTTTTSESESGSAIDRDGEIAQLSASVIALSIALGILGLLGLCLLFVWCVSRTAYGHYHYYRDDSNNTIVERWHNARRHESARGVLSFEQSQEAEQTVLRRHLQLPKRQMFTFKN